MATCGECGESGGKHLNGCPNGSGGGGGGRGSGKKPPRHKHDWYWVRRGGGVVGPYYDVYKCRVPGCTATDERNV